MDYNTIREQIRLLVDPLLLRFREELYGSGISYGLLSQSKMPVTVVVTGGTGGTDIDTLGFIKGIKTYSGGTLKGSDQTELSFTGGLSVTVAGVRTTVDISSKLSNPMTTIGDMIYATTGGTPVRLPIGDEAQHLAVSGGLPTWITFSGGGSLSDPSTTLGDILYRDSTALTRLGIGSTNQVLTVIGGIPAWATPTVVLSGYARQLSWYEDSTISAGNSKGPLRRIDAEVVLSGCWIYVKTAPTGASIQVDIKKATTPNGTYTSIFSSVPTIAVSTFVGASSSFSVSTLSPGDYLRMDITQVGSTVPGESLTVDLNTIGHTQ